MFLGHSNCPAEVGKRNPLGGAALTDLKIPLLDVVARLGDQPFAQVLQDLVNSSSQFFGRDFVQLGGARGIFEFRNQLGGEFVGMTFNQLNQPQGDHATLFTRFDADSGRADTSKNGPRPKSFVMKCNSLLAVLSLGCTEGSMIPSFPSLVCRYAAHVARLCSMQVRVVPSVGSNSVRNGFYHALRSHGWNNSRELVIGGIEQSTKLSRGAFASPVHH